MLGADDSSFLMFSLLKVGWTRHFREGKQSCSGQFSNQSVSFFTDFCGLGVNSSLSCPNPKDQVSGVMDHHTCMKLYVCT